MYLNSFNIFRAIAILIIVAGHCFDITGMSSDSLTNATAMNLIQGGTALFVFISGYLFYYVFYRKYEFKHFIRKKVNNVLTPYLLLGFIPLLLYISRKSDQPLSELFASFDSIIFEILHHKGCC